MRLALFAEGHAGTFFQRCLWGEDTLLGGRRLQRIFCFTFVAFVAQVCSCVAAG